MSGLAQMYKDLGFNVTGSDRGYGKSENETIFRPLENYDIKIYPQDGSFLNNINQKFNTKSENVKVVYSSAIENSNEDMITSLNNNLQLLHRSKALAEAIQLKNSQNNEQKIYSIAIAGSCGKTTVSAYTAEMLQLLTNKSSFLCGGIVNRFASKASVGNYFSPAKPLYFTFEADESDKSITNYSVDYAIILNAENDHYSREELISVFTEFIKKIRCGAVIEYDLYQEFPKDIFYNIKIKTFSATNSKADFFVADYASLQGHYNTIITDSSNKNYEIEMITPGIHNASNISSIIALFSLLDLNLDQASKRFIELQGAWRRFDYQGKLKSQAKVFDDYAHNVSKLKSCLYSAREAKLTIKNKIFYIFQPHGFGPLKLMAEDLLEMLEDELTKNEHFIFLPVYYAGGTTSFTPTSKEIVKNHKTEKNISYCEDRAKVAEIIHENSNLGDVIVIAGARDNSLAVWSKELTENK